MSERKRLQRAIRDAGYVEVRGTGGHITYRHPDGRTFSMPNLGRTKAVAERRGSTSLRSLVSMLRKMGVSV